MEPLTTHITFTTKVGTVNVFQECNSLWYFEFINGYNNGLHCAEGFKTFDKCYIHLKSNLKNWVNDMKQDQN